MKNTFLILVSALVLTLPACNKDKLDEVLFGTWNVTAVEGQYYLNGNAGATVQGQNVTGTVKFNSNGTGEQNYSFSAFGSNQSHTGAFTWESSDDEIIILQSGEPDLIWTRVTNQSNLQVATYNVVVDANENWDYTLTLEK